MTPVHVFEALMKEALEEGTNGRLLYCASLLMNWIESMNWYENSFLR